jgi:hypothetical protein
MKIGDHVSRDGRIIVSTSAAELAEGRPEARATSPEGTPSPFQRVLHDLGREIDRGEVLMKRAVSGGPMSDGELLALQARVYRYAEAVDLSAKLVDRAASGVKTVLQGQ